MSVIRVSTHLRAILVGAAIAAIPFGADAQEKHYRFAYDQPTTTGYGVVGDIFANKMKELSKGQFWVDQSPGAQLGQEPQVLQLLKSGDIDFAITSSANRLLSMTIRCRAAAGGPAWLLLSGTRNM